MRGDDMNAWVLGDMLPVEEQRDILNAYCYRMTHESIARWPDIAAYMRHAGYRMPIISDAEWLARTKFQTTVSGRRDKRARHCETQRGTA